MTGFRNGDSQKLFLPILENCGPFWFCKYIFKFLKGDGGRGAALMLQVFGNVGVVLALISFGVAILSLVLILYFAKFVP